MVRAKRSAWPRVGGERASGDAQLAGSEVGMEQHAVVQHLAAGKVTLAHIGVLFLSRWPG